MNYDQNYSIRQPKRPVEKSSNVLNDTLRNIVLQNVKKSDCVVKQRHVVISMFRLNQSWPLLFVSKGNYHTKWKSRFYFCYDL